MVLTAMVLMPLLKGGKKYISFGRRATKTAKTVGPATKCTATTMLFAQ